METTSDQTLERFINQLTPEQFLMIQEFARNRVMEPFEGRTGLETIQEASQRLSSGLNRLKNWKTRFRNRAAVEEELTGKELVPDPVAKSLLKKVATVVASFSQMTRHGFKSLETMLRDILIDFLKKGLELTAREDYESWILTKASQELQKEMNSLEDIRALDQTDRQRLINTLYPYRSRQYRILIASFDKSVNLFLGLIVATNLPGTGIVVSMINMVKTIIRLSNRINSLAAIYGFRLENPSALFETSALIIKSIERWERDEVHVPLRPEVMERIFTPSRQDFDKELNEYIDAVGIKEFYIAIPGIGMISLGKINMDNLKVDLLVRGLFQDYFLQKSIEASPDKVCYEAIIERFQMIYRAFQQHDYIKRVRTKLRRQHKRGRSASFQRFFKSMVGYEPEFESLSLTMSSDARYIFESLKDIQQSEIEKELDHLVRKLIED